MDLINFKRNLKLELYENKNKITWVEDFPWWLPISQVKKRLLNLKKVGGILTGSRALHGYRWNNKRVCKRKINDWDFILTREQLYDFFRLEGIYQEDLDSKFYTFNKSLLTFYDSYSDNPDDHTYIFNGRIDIIVQNDTPYHLYKGWKVHDFLEIWDNKCNLIEDFKIKNDFKHRIDINFFNINYLI